MKKIEFQNCYGSPQCGCSVKLFDGIGELENYLEEHPNEMEDLENGYAIIKEVEYED